MLKAKHRLEATVESIRKTADLVRGMNSTHLLGNGHHKRNHNVWAGIVAGMVGGAVASWTMEQFQAAWRKAAERLSKKPEPDSQQEAEQHHSDGKEQEPTTVKVASAVSQRVLHRELSERAKKVAGPAVHYGFGTTMGGLYGALAAISPKATSGAGMSFGAALWLGADEATLPALGLSELPTRYPLSTHAYALASHLVYGLTTEMVRRTVLRVWGRLSR